MKSRLGKAGFGGWLMPVRLSGEGSCAMILPMVLICADDPPPRRVLFVALLQSNYARTFFCQRGVAVASI